MIVLADAKGGVDPLAAGNLVVAAIALIVGALSVWYTTQGLKSQRTHNILSVVPVPFIALADYENLIRAKIRNDGIGPLIINKIEYGSSLVDDFHEDLVSYMPALPEGLYWSNFSSGYIRSVRPGDELVLLELEGAVDDIRFIEFRDACRNKLTNMSISVYYTDVYGTTFLPETRKLNWFGRGLASSKRAA